MNKRSISFPANYLTDDQLFEVCQLNQVTGAMEKMTNYSNAGVRLGWLIDPEQKCTWVFQPGVPSRQLSFHIPLYGGKVLPGFRIKLDVLLKVE